jgi:hypothetical protein
MQIARVSVSLVGFRPVYCVGQIRAINPVTHGDWEEKGVDPDVKVGAADALTTAEKLAADKLAGLERPPTGH